MNKRDDPAALVAGQTRPGCTRTSPCRATTAPKKKPAKSSASNRVDALGQRDRRDDERQRAEERG